MKGNIKEITFLERIRLSFSLYWDNIHERLDIFKITEYGLDVINYSSILTLEITLIFMAAGYLTINPYFVISTCYPFIFTLVLISLVTDSNLKTSTHMVIETINTSIIILLSFFFPIGTMGLSLSILTYYIASNLILGILFHVLDVEKIANNIIKRRSTKTMSTTDIDHLKQNIFSLLLIILIVEVITPLNFLSSTMVILTSAAIHIIVNTAASYFNKTRNPALQNPNTLENQMPHPWLITLSRNTGIIFIGAILSTLPIITYIEQPIVFFLCGINLIPSSTNVLSGSASFAVGVIAVKILQLVVPILLQVTKNLFIIENIVDKNNNPKNIHMNFFYQIFAHTLLLALSILDLDLLFKQPREYSSNIWCHLRGVTFQLCQIIKTFIICPLKYYITKPSEVDNLYLSLPKSKLKVQTNNDVDSFVYELSYKNEQHKFNEKTVSEEFNTGILSKVNTLNNSKIYIKA